MNVVYIIDDEEDLLFLVQDLFEKAGYTVQTFGSGQNFLEHLSKGRTEALDTATGPVFVVLCDFRLPDVNGLEIFGAVRSERGLRGFALQTGYPGVTLPGEKEADFPVKVFEKPVRMEMMLEFVGACFSGQRPSVE